MSEEEKAESNIYIFISRSTKGHLTLDNHKSVNHKETIELDSDDLERPIIKVMIKAGKNKDNKKDRLIPVEKPDESKE